MGYRNEAEIKQALGIESWRNLSKDKVIRFAAMMPNMSTEVALKIIDQFPVFKSFAVDAVNSMEKAHGSTLSANKQSQEHFHQASQETREIFKGELDKDLSWEQRQSIQDKIMEILRMESQKDSENKKFLDGNFNKVMIGVGTALTLGVVFVGGRVTAESKNNSEASPEA